MNLNRILYSSKFMDLAENLSDFLNDPALSQKDMKQLHQSLQCACERVLIDSFCEGHPQWSICSGANATNIFLYHSWKKERGLKQNIEQLKLVVQQIQDEFTPSEGPQITPQSAHELMTFLDRKYNFSQKILVPHPMFILLPDCGHKRHDAFCRPYSCCDGTTFCDIFMTHAVKDHATLPECIFLHELGHALNVKMTSDIRKIPKSFEKLNQTLLSPEGFRTVMQVAPETYATVFAMAILNAPELQVFDQYTTISKEVRNLLEQYFKIVIEAM